MSYSPVPSNAQLRYKPADHSWVSETSAGDFFAQATYLVNPEAISVSLSANNINVNLDETNEGIQTLNTSVENLLNYNNFVIPPFDTIGLINDANGNPTTVNYIKNTVIVATLTLTYDGNGYLTNVTNLV
jgi:hypothetical protein